MSSSYNRRHPRLSLDQYKQLIRIHQNRKQLARGVFSKFVRELGVPQSTVATCLRRGVKRYDYILWKSGDDCAIERG
jgi:hypothetical protein